MAYIGNSPANTGNYQIVDDIASGFNGSATSFALASGGIAITPAKSGQLLASINGVLQEPDDSGSNGFKVSSSNIVFSSAPASGDVFWSVYQGQNVDIGTPSNDVVDTAHIKDNAITADKIAAGAVVADIATGGISTAKIADDAVTVDKLANSINTAIAANTAKTGISSAQTSAITANTAKTGITSSQANAITANTAKTGISSAQTSAITANTAKTGISSAQTSAITANTAKTGISSAQTSAITANTAKTGITSSQATAITAALPKAGGTMTGEVTFTDNLKLNFGTGDDGEIYSDGNNLIVEGQGGTSEVHILSDDRIIIGSKGWGETFATFNDDSSVQLYYDSNKKFETASDGVLITGEVTGNGGGFRIKAGSATLGGIFKSGAIQGNSTTDITIFAETGKKIHLSPNGSANKVLTVSGSTVSIGNEANLRGSLNIFNGTNFSTATAGTGHNIFLTSDATSGNNVYGASLSFSRVQYQDRTAAAIAAVQTGSDEDSVGLAFFTHPSADATDPIVEAMRIDANGTVSIPAGITRASMPAGSVIQVISVNYHTAYYNANSSSKTDIPNFVATITPRSTSSKILVMIHASMNLDCDGRMGFARNGTQIFDNMLGTHRDGESHDQSTYSAQYLDSPSSTNAVVYQVYTIATGCANDVWINRSKSGTTDNGRSGITLMEIAG